VTIFVSTFIFSHSSDSYEDRHRKSSRYETRDRHHDRDRRRVDYHQKPKKKVEDVHPYFKKKVVENVIPNVDEHGNELFWDGF
jgi:hypothetical protein